MSILFVGGVHGAGKSTLCRAISSLIPAKHVTASELLKNKESTARTRRQVQNVEANQFRIIAGLRNYDDFHDNLLLDGHFTLLDTSRHIREVPFATFSAISPIALLLVEADPIEIELRLKRRLETDYDLELIDQMVAAERHHANAVSSLLRVPLESWHFGDDITMAVDFFRSQIRHHNQNTSE